LLGRLLPFCVIGGSPCGDVSPSAITSPPTCVVTSAATLPAVVED
jgi:hypothetical protein